MNINRYSHLLKHSCGVCKYLLLLSLICVSALLFIAETRAEIRANTNRQIGNILIIVPKNTNPYLMIVNSIKRELILKGRKESVQVLNLGSRTSSDKIQQGNRLVITLGAKSLDYYLNSGVRTPFISSFITDGAFSTFITKNPRRRNISKRYVGGISLEQPLYRIVSLMKLIKKNVKSIGVVLGPNTLAKRSLLRRQIQRQVGGVLNVANIQYRDNPVNKLRAIFKKSQLVLVIPDKASFNRSLAHWVVTLSYKHKVPVFSYSKKYADAGALISLYSDPEQIGRQTANMLMSYLQTPRIKPLKIIPPKYFQIAINQSVSQAFGLKLPHTETLLRQLYKVEP